MSKASGKASGRVMVTITLQDQEAAHVVSVLRASDPLGVHVGGLVQRIMQEIKRQVEAARERPADGAKTGEGVP